MKSSRVGLRGITTAVGTRARASMSLCNNKYKKRMEKRRRRIFQVTETPHYFTSLQVESTRATLTMRCRPK